MKLQYFGTAAAEGIPALFCDCPVCTKARRNGGKDLRTRSQAMVNDSLLVDFPCDTLTHSQRFGFNLNRIHNVIITHSHQDHLYPEDLLFRMPPFSDGRGVINIYGNEKVGEIFGKISEIYDGPRWEIEKWVHVHYLEPYKPIVLDGVTVTAMLANHDRREACYIYLLEQDGKRILYGNDTGFFPEATYEWVRGKRCDLLSLDCTLLMLPDGKNHMGLEDDVSLVKKLRQMGTADEKTKIVITHFSHNGQLVHDEIVEKGKPYGFDVAYDGYVVTI